MLRLLLCHELLLKIIFKRDPVVCLLIMREFLTVVCFELMVDRARDKALLYLSSATLRVEPVQE